jgi:DHA2 family multidrug resistance protein
MHEAFYKPRHNPWLIAVTVTLATIMEVLDTSIVNVALPHIAGSLGASQDESTWVISCYLISNAIVLPAGAYLGSIVGRKRFYMSCVVIFALSSLLCGLAPSLPLLLLFRVLQGLGGGGLQPSEQSILADTFPKEKLGQAFAVYGLAVVTAPVIGPTIGGWITDNYDWRWIFFINIPISILSLTLTHYLVEDTPHIKREVEEARKGGFQLDTIGFGLVALTFGCIEVVLDKGQQDDWFSSHFISSFAIAGLVGLVCLIAWELGQTRRGHRAILDLRLFASKNFSLAFLMMFVLGFALYATTVALPQLLQTLMGYTAELSGLAMSSGGLATIICMPIVAILVSRVDGRFLIMFGFGALAFALYHTAKLDLQMSFGYAAELRFLQSIGLAFLFIPINTQAYVGIPGEKNNDVSGLTNLARNVGGSAGTAFFTTILARRAQVHQHFLVQHVSDGSLAWMNRFQALTQQALGNSPSSHDAQKHALAQIYQTVQAQASVLSYIDLFQILAVFAALMVPVVLLMRKPPKGARAAAH